MAAQRARRARPRRQSWFQSGGYTEEATHQPRNLDRVGLRDGGGQATIPIMDPILWTAAALIPQLATLATYWLDKRRAKKGHGRISEKRLLIWSSIGPVGAILGIWFLRHKSRKVRYLAWAIPAIGLGLGCWLYLAYRISTL